MSFDLRAISKECEGSFSASLTLNGDQANGVFAGSNCVGEHGEGSLTVRRPTSSKLRYEPDDTELQLTYGDAIELATVETVFIDTGNDLGARNAIARRIRSCRGLVQVAEGPDKADAILLFDTTEKITGSASFAQPHTTPSGLSTFMTGFSRVKRRLASTGHALIIPDPNTVRVVWQDNAVKMTKMTRTAALGFAERFLESLSRVKAKAFL